MKCIQTHYSPHGPPEMTVNSVLSQVTCVSMTEERLGPTRKSRWLSQSFVRTRRPVSQAAPTRCAHWGWPVLLLGEREVRPCAQEQCGIPSFQHRPTQPCISLLPFALAITKGQPRGGESWLGTATFNEQAAWPLCRAGPRAAEAEVSGVEFGEADPGLGNARCQWMVEGMERSLDTCTTARWPVT